MSLKFPNARLYVQDLLSHGGLSGPVAIARSAYEFGLISDKDRIEVESMLISGELCFCLLAAHCVLSSYFKNRIGRPGVPEANLSEVWKALLEEFEFYKEKLNLKRDCQCTLTVSDCAKLAPALFDLMLQQISRYP